ncbi:hypothetical protein [Agrobacterium fabrum]|uniref:hypothetical protein n=1 Tax=Agrobacterium fabrum TaxID=1176649 RepID=UPI002474856D|nr:hypothetical protein [Agrobacterium fabrum]MDH6298811.1 hypothetical protein [Agrobacterium fabrum]
MAAALVYEKVLKHLNFIQNLEKKDSSRAHSLLSAFLKQETEGRNLPNDVIVSANALNEEDLEVVNSLRKIAAECREIEAALNREWAGLPEAAKSILKKNARATYNKCVAFSDGMPLWQSLLYGASTTLSIVWDLWTVIKVPDTSLFPRVVPFLVGTVPITIGYLIAPGANWKQFYEAIFQDRVILGIPARGVLSYGIEHSEFYSDKPKYLATVGTLSVSFMLALNMPRPIIETKDNRTMSQIGRSDGGEEAGGRDLAMTAQLEGAAARLDDLQQKLKSVALHIALGQGTSDALSRIASQTKRVSALLLRSANKYVTVKHNDHGKKFAIVMAWDALLATMIGAASGNQAQIGALIPYIAFAQRRMLEVLFDSSQGVEEMSNLFARSGATAFYQFFGVSVPLLARGRTAFDDGKMKGAMTGALIFITLSVMQYTPDVMFWAGGVARRLCRRRAINDASHHSDDVSHNSDDDEFFDAEDDTDTEDFFDALSDLTAHQHTEEEEEDFFDALATQAGTEASQTIADLVSEIRTGGERSVTQ